MPACFVYRCSREVDRGCKGEDSPPECPGSLRVNVAPWCSSSAKPLWRRQQLWMHRLAFDRSTLLANKSAAWSAPLSTESLPKLVRRDSVEQPASLSNESLPMLLRRDPVESTQEHKSCPLVLTDVFGECLLERFKNILLQPVFPMTDNDCIDSVIDEYAIQDTLKRPCCVANLQDVSFELRTAPQEKPPVSDRLFNSVSGDIEENCLVPISGLTSTKVLALNNLIGVVRGYEVKSARYFVRCKTEMSFFRRGTLSRSLMPSCKGS